MLMESDPPAQRGRGWHAFGVDDIAPGNNPAGPARLPARMMMCLQPHLPFPTLFPTVATLSERTWSSFR